MRVITGTARGTKLKTPEGFEIPFFWLKPLKATPMKEC